MSDKAWETVIKLFDDYTIILSKAKFKAKHGKERKILTSKQYFKAGKQESKASRQYIWKIVKWNPSNNIFTKSSKRNYYKSI